jgi:hypothetical protein
MFRTTVTGILIVLTLTGAIPASAAERTVSEQVAKLKIGRKIKVKLTGGDTLKGRMGTATAEQFSLQPRDAGKGAARVFQFTEVQSVTPDGMSTARKWIIGVAIGWISLAIIGSRL